MRGFLALALLGTLAIPAIGRAQLSTAIEVVKYLPNRALDVLDLVRLRVRMGPGNALELRAGDRLEYFRGSYRCGFIGLPGARRGPWPRLPLGLEGRVTPPAIDESEEPPRFWGDDPGYGRSETVLGFQAGLLGLELGVNPLQFLDLAFGIIFLDPADDDW
jgi:hypothetical protein